MLKSSSQKHGGATVSIDYEDNILYAVVANGRSAIKRLTIIADDGVTLPSSVEMRITSLGQDIAAPWTKAWPESSNESVEFFSITDITWLSSNLWDIKERQPAELSVRLAGIDEAFVFGLEVSSPNSWFSSDDALPSLAAFVQPNHPSIRAILDVAAEKLKKGGFEPSFSGYQVVSHIPHMVEAIYDAVCDLKIRYSDPPASWSDSRQKIRDAQTIVDERVGTCLDTAVLFAALLENVGLHPILVLIPKHAFVGYWTESTESETEVSAVRDLINYIDSGELHLFETTVVCESDVDVSYTEATKAGLEKLRNMSFDATTDQRSEYAVVDVVLCRTPHVGDRPIIPMPARFIRADGTIEVVQYQPESLSINILIDKLSREFANNKVAAAGVDMNVPPRLKKWLDDLLDLTLRNPLVNFVRRTRGLEFVMPDGGIGLIEDLLHQGVEFELIPHSYATHDGQAVDLQNDRGGAVGAAIEGEGVLEDIVASAMSKRKILVNHVAPEFVRRARNLVSDSKSFREESGSNGLFLALGSLVWVPEGKSEIRSPLILVPVNIVAKDRSRHFFLSLDSTSAVTPNFSLVEKLRREHGIVLDGLANLQEDDSGIDVPATIAHVREKLIEAKLTGARVDENAVLGLFDFSTYRLWRDLVDNWRKFDNNPLVHHLIYSPNEPFVDPVASDPSTDLDTLLGELPIEADSSQVKAVSQALAGKTFVMQGPPGTGKSQTITNMLARALNDGKRILFVAEKKDALDVVVERLDAVKLRPYILDLHDKGMNYKAVKEQLAKVIDLSIAADHNGFNAALSEYTAAVSPLQKYRNDLHEVGSQGESVASALDKLLTVPGDYTVPVPGAFVAESTPGRVSELEQVARVIADIGPATGNALTNPWSLSTRKTDLEVEDGTALRDQLTALASMLSHLQTSPNLLRFVRGVTSVEELVTIAKLPLDIAQSMSVTSLNHPSERQARLDARDAVERYGKQLSEVGGDLHALESLPIGDFLTQASLAQMAFMGGFKIDKIAKLVNRTLGWKAVGKKQSAVQDLNSLNSLAEQAKALRDIARKYGVGTDETPFDAFDAASLDAIVSQISRIDGLAEFASLAHSDGATGESALADIVTSGNANIAQFCGGLVGLCAFLGVSDESQSMWCQGGLFGTRLVDSIPAWFEDASQHNLMSLGRWTKIRAQLDRFESHDLFDATSKVLIGEVPYSEFANAFLRGYYEALTNFMMIQRGFNNFQGDMLDSYVRRLREAYAQLRDRLPSVLSDRLYGRRGFDASVRIGAIGDLLALLTQANAPRGMGIRTLLRKHWSLITRITPCVLASPDSTVRFIDPSLEGFDLVVFDEASQIKVAHALGALGRGKASVIAGDVKQMPPTSIAQGSSTAQNDDEAFEEELVGTDVESILSLCSVSRVPEVMLNWHYRSEDESLIAFSNSKYYQRKLLSFPSPDSRRDVKGLSFEYLENGEFVRPGMKGKSPQGTNLAEAEAIVAEIARRAADDLLRDDSVGVVTFNMPQKKLIETMLVESPDEHIQRALQEGLGGEEIFVKNLEQVQGKERDVVLFSIAFSKNSTGQLPLNFGPLNNTGGQRRLNVAVTRARKQVKVFCSFRPDELLSRNPSAIGVQHLGEFLKMASEGAEANQALFAESAVSIDRHRASVAQKLRGAGLVVKEDLGLSGFKVDLAVYESPTSEKAVLGILLDGKSWSSRETAVDRDALPIQVLGKKMGWPLVERIWLPGWLRDESGEIVRIQKALAIAVEESKKPRERKSRPPLAPTGSNATTTMDAQSTSRAKGSPSRGAATTSRAQPKVATSTADVLTALESFLIKRDPFMATEPKILGNQDALNYLFDSQMVTRVRALAKALTENEGPVSPDRLTDFVGGCYSFARLTAKRRFDILSVGFPGHSQDTDGFFYPAGSTPETFTGWKYAIPSMEETYRALGSISLCEISNAAVAVCREFAGVQQSKLQTVVTTIFGIRRAGEHVAARCQAGIDLALSQDRLVLDEGYYRATS